MKDELTATVALVMTDEVGPVRYRRLLERFGSALAGLGASAGALAEAMQVSVESARRIKSAVDSAAAQAEIERAEKAGVSLVGIWQQEYPTLLKEALGPPLLYVKGQVACLHMPAVAIVGTRHPTPYGRDQARRFATKLAEAGLAVVSGLAIGIDTEAHRGALACRGLTVAVFGCGLSTVYPPQNRPLAEEILESGGAIVSELPMDFPVRSENFPRRNRIISGLAVGTLVVEAGNRSGALITARYAGEQDREVFALPGPVGSLESMGTNALIRDGAKLVSSAEDVLTELHLERFSLETSRRLLGLAPESPPAQAPQSGPSAAILEVLSASPLDPEEVARQLKLDSASISSILVRLELSGKIKRVAGGYVAAK